MEIRQTPGGHALGLYNFIVEVAEALNKQEIKATGKKDSISEKP